jgi:subtilisin-like proprotein convertase family protein
MPKYIAGGKPIELELDPDFVAVKFNTSRRSVLEKAVAASAAVGDYRDRIDVPQFGLTLIPTAPAPTAAARSENAVRSMSADGAVDQVAAVYRRGDTRIVPTGRIVLAFRAATPEAARQRTLADHKLNAVEKSKHGEITAEINDPNADVFDVVERLSALQHVEFAEPDLVTIAPRRSYRALPPRGATLGLRSGNYFAAAAPMVFARPGPTAVGPDPLMGQQYYLELIEAAAAADEAEPSLDITVAVLDEGVDTAHQDLTNVRKSYDGTDDDEFQEPKATDAHGTACAGIVGATANNQLGVRGVAAGCSMQAVRIAYSDNSGDNWITTNRWIARSIDWAWENGADVLSNSWGGGSPSDDIIRAFQRARTQGRGGKGSVIVIAAGNASSPVDFPGNLDNVLTVSASNQDDEPKTKTSSDGESWWGSNFGPEVDVAAPGVGIVTTDISGDRGYNRTGNLEDYVLNFNGTSSACPQVAAVCALILSRNPSLTEAEVRTIVRETTDKVGSVLYDPATGHNPRMGQGRVNALRAVRRARSPIESGTEFDRVPNVAIPDADSNGVSDGIEVVAAGIVTGIEVEVDISHTYRGDLRVALVPPSGNAIMLHDRVGGSAHDVKTIYTPENSPSLAELVRSQPTPRGNWALHVADLASADIGRLNRWRLRLEVAVPPNSESKVVVPSNGTIPDNLPAGIRSETNVAIAGSISGLTVEVNITHTWRGDLEVSLVHDGITAPLHAREGESEDNIFQTYTMDNSPLADFRGREASGTWTLHVADRASRDTGKLSRWSLEVNVV